MSNRAKVVIAVAGIFGLQAFAQGQPAGSNNSSIPQLRDPMRAYAKAGRATTQAINSGSFQVVDFATVELDSRSAVTTGAAWKFTVPSGHAGIYLVATTVTIVAGVGGIFVIGVFKNGAEAGRLVESEVETEKLGGGGSILLSLAAGDTVDIRVFQNSGGAKNIGGDVNNTNVSIIRLVTDR